MWQAIIQVPWARVHHPTPSCSQLASQKTDTAGSFQAHTTWRQLAASSLIGPQTLLECLPCESLAVRQRWHPPPPSPDGWSGRRKWAREKKSIRRAATLPAPPPERG